MVAPIEKGLKRSSYELQKQAIPLLEQLIESSANQESAAFKEQMAQLKAAIVAFEKEADRSRLTDTFPPPSQEEFRVKENLRREAFFSNAFTLRPAIFQAFLHKGSYPFAIPLDGQTSKMDKEFNLYTEQFYRFLVQNDTSVSYLVVKVHKEGEVIHEEKIVFPLKNTIGWERYLTKDGMIFIPETKLKSDFGIDLRLRFVCDLKCNFSMIIAQKAIHPGYQLSVSLDHGMPLYECHFFEPPPWQLGILRKPTLPHANRPIGKTSVSQPLIDKSEQQQPALKSLSFPVLDQLVEELNADPLLIAQYVQHEIAFVDPFLRQEKGVFQAPGIHRDPCTTYLEKAGSPWEQCQLLVYLLRKAGFRASYAKGDPCSLPKAFVEKMFSTRLPDEQEEVLLHYPWVVFSDGKETISLFPWIKEMQVTEGYDLYNLLSEEYASADRWILRYLKGDDGILKHIAPDGDDTAAVLFARFAEEELRKQGLSLADVGVHRTPLKKQFTSWIDFPRPVLNGTCQIFDSLNDIPNIFAFAAIEIFSHNNPQKRLLNVFPLTLLNCSTVPIRFSPLEENKHRLFVQQIGESQERYLDLDETDHLVDVKVTYEVPIGSQGYHAIQSLTMAKGTSAALCFHFGGASSKKTSYFYEKFSGEKDEKKRLHALLSFVGTSYFEKCTYAEQLLARLHKATPTTVFAFGLAKLSPDTTRKLENQDLTLPQIDMFWFRSESALWNPEAITARLQFEALATVDSSANEHQILREVFKDPYAISTVKLLQLAHLEQQKKGLEGEGFLTFTSSSLEAANKTPEAAQALYFPHLKDLRLREVKAAAPAQWEAMRSLLLNPNKPFSNWAYAYMTPGLTSSQEGIYKEMGTLILHPYTRYALISNNNLIFHGGLGSPKPSDFFTPDAIKRLKLVPTGGSSTNSYTLDLPNFSYKSNLATPSVELSLPGKETWISDIRSLFKVGLSHVGDPVDIVTGAFYIDETDLVLPGSFALAIRRNYNSQNPLIGHLGCGWKLSLNPFLIEQDGKRFAAELDGTVIAYSYNQEASRWEVDLENNPELFNFGQKGHVNPFHAYIEKDVLYGTDGSRRFFENGFLKKWIDARGNTLSFFYNNEQLSRIENSNGDFYGLHYNHEGKISEIYARDGRRISYDYNSQGDLVKVTLPNTAVITYEYDRAHRIIRETKPHGRVLENKYDDAGRVIEQKSPMGPRQEMIATATFEYGDGVTTVTDANNGKTTYQIFEKQIYKVIDPLGFSTLQSWFIDENTWFDPEAQQIVAWDQVGGAAKSIKSTTDKRGLTTYYLYDQRGNLAVIGLKGNDLTGNGETDIAKKLLFNDLNLCIEEEVCGQKTVLTYDQAFPYLPKRIEKYSDHTLTSYVEYEYNSHGLVTKEDHSGAITLWKYDSRGLPCQKTQITGTDDPDLLTTYAYNQQGQCIQVTSADGIQESDYDIMGNPIQSKSFSLSGKLLAATYLGYNLNQEPIWKQTANAQNTLYIDYHASGLIKATRQNLAPSSAVAYTLYEYDPCGYLIEEVDPRGYCTYREYDAIGQVRSETKEKLTTLFTYEPGGLPETCTSPSGAQTTRFYTTNGLLKEEIFPDGTKNSFVYDFSGRPILETKNDLSWEIRYDDAHHCVVRTQLNTSSTEISEFDARGNLIRFIDAAGYTSEKTYDSLNRLKVETTPSGKQTLWSYQGDRVICILPNGERTTHRYEGGGIVEAEVMDAQGVLIARSSVHYDPETDIQHMVQGEEITTTWLNALGLPLKVQKGSITTTREYDSQGHCIAITDGDGRKTYQRFDGLGRLSQKELPDGGLIGYVYDLDSNLTEYHLPNDTMWTASYDSMRRKTTEELRAGRQSSLRWEYMYENGYLKAAKDPMQRMYTYLYEPSGRLSQEIVNGGHRTYTYDSRGFIATAEQTRDSTSSWLSSWVYGSPTEHSLVERAYDADGRLSLESIYLNSTLIQQSKQTWDASKRSLQIGDHTRDSTYQNNRLAHISTGDIDLAYAYDLSGSLKSKSTPWSTTTIAYNPSGLPEHVQTNLSDHSHQETLAWYSSGRLHSYSSTTQQKEFSYTVRGHLQTAGVEKYDFDFGKAGTGVRTKAPDSVVPKNGLDPFGKILTEMVDKNSIAVTYNPMGQVISQGKRQLEWDPWGRLIKVSDGSLTWEASYDALGRRLQTRYTPGWSSTLVTTSFYDPEEEFQEIGVKYGAKTFWKIYGPHSCDAVTDGTGAVALMHNALDQLVGIVSPQGTIYSQELPSSYGPQASASIPTNLLSYAQSLSWHSQALDPTGLIWMGARYYDPKSGRFLSPDPIKYPACLDLYAYAGGDPVNYLDADGRWFSSIYQSTKPSIICASDEAVKQGIQIFNKFTAFRADYGLTNSRVSRVGSFKLTNGAIQFVNGIQNLHEHAMASAEQLSRYAQGAEVCLIYNAMNLQGPHQQPLSFFADVLECGLGYMGIHSPTVQLLKNSWKAFNAIYAPEAKILVNSHSGGTICVFHALKTSPKSIQQRIISVAIAPALIIPEELCFKSYNYRSRLDFVTHFDVPGNLKYGDQLQILEPHPDAHFPDHGYLSPTFDDIKEWHIKEFVKEYGGKK